MIDCSGDIWFPSTSSNSSFIECVRKHNAFTSYISHNNDNSPTCLKGNTPLTPNRDCVTSSRHDLRDAASYKFMFCSFSQLIGGSNNGGALCCSGSSIQTSTSLLVASCTFS